MSNAHVHPAFQTALRGMCAEPAPVRIVTCPLCYGSGWRETHIDSVGIGHGSACTYCAGTGRIATEEGEV